MVRSLIARWRALLLLIVLASACADVPEQELAILTVSPYLAPCIGVEPQPCMVVDEGDGPMLFYGAIEGFDFSWGREVTMQVSVEEEPMPAQDASTKRYALISVVENNGVSPGDEFSIAMRADAVEEVTDLGGTLLADKPFTCAEATTCQALIQAVEAARPPQDAPLVTFSFGDPVTGPLRLERVAPLD